MNEITEEINTIATSENLTKLISDWVLSSKIEKKDLEITEQEKIILKKIKLIGETESNYFLFPGSFMSELLLSELLPIITKGVKEVISSELGDHELEEKLSEVLQLIDQNREKLKKQYKEVFSTLRKRVEREIDQSKYNALQTFSKLSSGINNFEGMPELNLQLNPIEIYDSFNWLKSSLTKILTDHSIKLDEEITTLISEMLNSLERKIRLLSKDIAEKEQQLVTTLEQEKNSLEKKNKDIHRELVKETEILRYEIEKVLKGIKVEEKGDQNEELKEIMSQKIENIFESFTKITDQIMISIRKELDGFERITKEYVESYINNSFNKIGDNLATLVSQHSFFQKEQNDVLSLLVEKTFNYSNYLKNTKNDLISSLSIISDETRRFKEKITRKSNEMITKIKSEILVEVENNFAEVIDLFKVLRNDVTELSTNSQQLKENNYELEKSLEEYNKKFQKLLKEIEKNKNPEKVLKQVKNLYQDYNAIYEVFNKNNELSKNIYKTSVSTTSQVDEILNRVELMVSSYKTKEKQIYEELENVFSVVLNGIFSLEEIITKNEQKFISFINEIITRIDEIDTQFSLGKNRITELGENYKDALATTLVEFNNIKNEELLNFWKRWGDIVVDKRKAITSHINTIVNREINSLRREIKEFSSINIEEKSEKSNTSINFEEVNKEINRFVNSYEENISKLISSYVSPVTNALEMSKTIAEDIGNNVNKQLQTDLINLKEDILNKRKIKSEEIKKIVEEINEKMIYSFNKLEEKLGKIVENLLESYEILSGVSPELLKAAYLSVNEALDKLMNATMTKILQELNEAHETFLRTDPLLSIDNKIHEIKNELTKEKGSDVVLKERLTKQVIYPVNEIIRDLGVFNGKILVKTDIQ